MASYDELLALYETAAGTALQKRVRVAVVVACDVIRAESNATPNHANRLLWAQRTLADPDTAAKRMLWAALAQNRANPAASILAADDATVQTAVNTAVDLLAGS